MSNRWYRSNLVQDKKGNRTCRACGREPKKCWHCFHQWCESCSTNHGRCEHCQRPQRPITNGLPERLVAYLQSTHHWMSEPFLAKWFGVSARDIRRALRKYTTTKVAHKKGWFWRGTGRREYRYRHEKEKL